MERKPRLLEQVRQKIRLLHYSIRTEQTYIHWIKRFILFHGKRHPLELGATEIEAFLTHLAMDRKVSASTQNQAFNALLFLYKKVLEQPLPEKIDAVRAKRPEHLPVVLTRNEARALLARLEGRHWLVAALLYGSGLRLLECARLRVKDLDLERRAVLVRDGKG